MARGQQSRRLGRAAFATLVVIALTLPFASPAGADQASSARYRLAASVLDSGEFHSCAVLNNGVRCWGYGVDGRLGNVSPNDIGDNETPDFPGPVNLGSGRTAKAIAAGYGHTCALLDNATVRCWGLGTYGQLGYGNTDTIGDDETPGSTGPVNLGSGRTAVAISAGGNDSCALLDNGKVRCWGYNSNGELGYGNTNTIGDDETPGTVPAVNLGPGRTATAISTGGDHTCALLDNARVRCWGFSASGELGYGNTHTIGDDETPGSTGSVNLGAHRTAVAISAGGSHTCALLDNGKVRCWGSAFTGQLGYGNTHNIGDNESPAAAGPINLGPGRTATTISAGNGHTCAVLDNGRVRCWGYNAYGGLGYGNTDPIGDDETPAAAGPVNLGPGRTARAVSAANAFTCAVLDNGRVRCWGTGQYGRLGYGNTDDIGDDETPASVGPVSLGGPLPVLSDSVLTLSVDPHRDHTGPYRFVARGRLAGAFFTDPAICAGVVRVSLTRGTETVASESVTLTPACSYRKALTSDRRGALTVKARFAGNGSLRSNSAHERVRAG